jgi:hypothetical protein
VNGDHSLGGAGSVGVFSNSNDWKSLLMMQSPPTRTKHLKSIA